MKSQTKIMTSRTDIVGRLSNVLQASRIIRSEVALTMCESSELRVTTRQLRMESLRMSEQSAAWKRELMAHKEKRARRIAHAIAIVLASRGFGVAMAGQPQDNASVQ